MKLFNTKLKKTLWIVGIALISFVVLVIVFISPLTKYLVEKHDVKFTGREIKMDWAYVNPFTGYLHFNNLKIYENKSDSLFISAKGLSANFALIELISGNYEITELNLNRSRIVFVQNLKVFNFDDLIAKFTSDKKVKNTKPVHFDINKIVLKDCEVHYREQVIPINYFVKKVNIESTGFHWNSDTMLANFSFQSGVGTGKVKGKISVNFKSLDYRLSTVINRFDLSIIGQYLKDLSNFGVFRADMDADINATGNFKRAAKLNASGLLAFNEFHIGKSVSEDYASFKRFAVGINTLNPENKKYMFDSVLLDQPFVKYERYDNFTDNIQMMFGKGGSNVTAANASTAKVNIILKIAGYVELLAKNFLNSDYQVNRLLINKANVIFNDYSLPEKFSTGMKNLTVYGDSINRNNKRVNMSVNGEFIPYGKMALRLSINPNDSSDFDINYKLDGVALSMFNPYLVNYTSFPMDRGILQINGNWHVLNGIIRSNNHVLLIDPRLSERVKTKDTKWIPLRFLMFFVRETGNTIDYEVPISGDLKNPKFHARDVIWDIVKNIVTKPFTSPYRTEVKQIEIRIEKSLSIKWEINDAELFRRQSRFLDQLGQFLKSNPETKITVKPLFYYEKEKEHLIYYEAKKRFYRTTHPGKFTEDDSTKVTKMSVKDSMFIRYLNKATGAKELFTVQDKCENLLGAQFVKSKLNALDASRKATFLSSLGSDLSSKQVVFLKPENVLPFNGFSAYEIDYKNEMPEKLIKAYEKLDELDNERPRKKFKKLRDAFRRKK